LTETARLDRAILNQEIEAIFQDTAGNLPPRQTIEQHLETLVRAGRRGEVQKAAEHLIPLLRLDLDDLRKAALLSLMVRLTGKRKFDPVAAYVLEKPATYVTWQG
jgi:ABC-type glutathione transport system ATPase component